MTFNIRTRLRGSQQDNQMRNHTTKFFFFFEKIDNITHKSRKLAPGPSSWDTALVK